MKLPAAANEAWPVLLVAVIRRPPRVGSLLSGTGTKLDSMSVRVNALTFQIRNKAGSRTKFSGFGIHQQIEEVPLESSRSRRLPRFLRNHRL